ncbi:hypothetical protein Q1695_016269 [Nippostrongylus brasiliensis]|nr:hypothetical protein Q1695_016269 [Nippostrongylus brasiliensis]
MTDDIPTGGSASNTCLTARTPKVEPKTLKIPNVVARNIGSGEFLSEKEGIKSFKPSTSLAAAKTQSAEKENGSKLSKELSASMEKPMLNSAEKEKGPKFSNAEKERKLPKMLGQQQSTSKEKCKSAEKSRERAGGRRLKHCGNCVFVAISVLTFLHNSTKAVILVYNSSDDSPVLSILGWLEVVVTVVVFLSKMISLASQIGISRFVCVMVMLGQLLINMIITILYYTSGSTDTGVQVSATLAIGIDIVILLFFFRGKDIKVD